MSRRRIIYVLLLCLVFALSGCNKGSNASDNASPTIQPTEQPVSEVSPTPTPMLQPSSICPLTGLSIESEDLSKLRPFAVMIDNEVNARPQSGLISADIVYEMPVEGNITRYMAVFHDISSDKIGPVRSARPYFIDKALEFNAVYVHCGGSPQALKDIVDLKVNALNDLKGDNCFWRASDRKAPHNLYASTKLIREVMATKKLENKTAPSYFKFNETFIEPTGKLTNTISINYDHSYKVGYEYSSADKIYYRTVNGNRLKDKETGKEIATTNIIIEKVAIKVLDKAGRLQVDNIGNNRGYFLSGGKLTEIEWYKSGRTNKTIYKDMQGNEIQLNKGKTWIQVVPDTVSIDIKG